MITAAPPTQTVDAVRVFEHEPDLVAGLDDQTAEVLRHRAVAPSVVLRPGPWEPDDLPLGDGTLGLLVLEGTLTRTVTIGDHSFPELVGPGDLLRPWDQPGTDHLVEHTSSWNVVQPTRLAVLDQRFAASACRFPTVMSALLERCTARMRTLAIHLAIAQVRHADTRLALLLWQLADRWGRVTPDGVHVPIPLTHEVLAHLTCMRRPTASSALTRLRRLGELERFPDGTWLLLGDGPPQLG